MTAECLNSSLTPLDWVKEVRPPGASATGPDAGDRLGSYVKPPRKPPPVPIDLNANLDAMESRHYRFVDEKPPYSYASLIIFAINSSAQRRMTLSQIYDWIASNFIYYKDAHTGWKNSIRHNLSLNKCFRKVSRPKGETGKGSYWEIDHGAVPQRSPETDKPPLTPDSSAGSDMAKISPGPSTTLTELNRSSQHNSSLSSNELSPYHYWDTSSPGPSRTTASFYPSSSNPSAGLFATPPHHPGVHDSAAYQSPRPAFSDLNIDTSESFSSFYHTLVNSSLGLSDFFKLAPGDPSLGTPSCGQSIGPGVSQDLNCLMQLAEDIQMKHGLQVSKVEELSQVFSRGQHDRFGLADKEFDLLAGSFRKFITDWRKTPQSSVHLGSLPSWPPPVTQTTSAYSYETQSIQAVSAYMYEPPPPTLSQVNEYLVHPSTIQATAVTTYPYTAEGAYSHHEHHQLYLAPSTPRDFPQQRSSPLLAADPNFDNVPIPESSEGVPVEALEPTFRPESPEYFDDGFEKAFQDACS